MHKKVCWTCKVVFFLIRPTDFFCRSRCRRHLALHDFIFLFEEIISILARGLLLVLANLYISNTPSVTFHEVITRTPSKTKWRVPLTFYLELSQPPHLIKCSVDGLLGNQLNRRFYIFLLQFSWMCIFKI